MAVTAFSHLSLVPDITDTATTVTEPEIAAFFSQAEAIATQLENWSNNDPRASSLGDPLLFGAHRARLRIVAASVEYMRFVVRSAALPLGEAQRLATRIELLKDRFQELDDSLAWAAEAPGALKRLALEELGS